jgi:tetratricopeptide (TPR) repeat protein
MTTRLVLVLLLWSSTVLADTSPTEEAGKHFGRGVSLYDEADYRAALVEFRRAYEIAPNAVVLYNIGETYYQLQNYASALTALERYLAESPATAEHRAEVQKTLEILRSRVGKVAITTNVPGCEVTVDDEFVGKTPLAQPVPVSIGRRKITAMRSGLPPDTRFVEVAAGDTAAITLTLEEPKAIEAPVSKPLPDVAEEPPGSSHATTAWIVTGALGAAGIGMGIATYVESKHLQDARNTFGVTHDELQSKATRVTTFGIIGDSLGVAALIAGGFALKFTLSSSSTHEVHAALTPTGVVVGGTFH